ncbi:MAG: carboxypeptidase-like regulatory domain-containing protein [Cyclobacteriaceae bacterium]|nr:carboxypeptidase-like regulatory domain-containing protein [Cyclobacteriaceae bacterium]
MKRVILIMLLVAAFLSLYGQSQITIKGRIIDKKSGDAVSFAHVGLCEKAIGTVSNVNGEFELKLPQYYPRDTLCISAIGYKTYKNLPEKLKDIHPLIVEMQPETSVLQDVLILDEAITGKRVLEKAINRISRNYSSRPYQLEGYYRDYLKKNNEYISFLEAAITVQDMGINTQESKSRIRINQLRFSDNYEENYYKYLHKDEEDTLKEILEGESAFYWGNEFSNMRYHNPIRNRLESVPFLGVFDNFYQSSYQFNIGYYTYVDEEEVYVINFKPNEMYKYHHVQADGEIYIRVRDYAILKFNYHFYVTKFGDKKKWYELNVEYRDYQNMMFLKYISYVNYFKIYTGFEISELYQYREYFVTDIHYPDFETIPKSENIDKSVPLHAHEAPNELEFWVDYNVILLEKPLKE